MIRLIDRVACSNDREPKPNRSDRQGDHGGDYPEGEPAGFHVFEYNMGFFLAGVVREFWWRCGFLRRSSWFWGAGILSCNILLGFEAGEVLLRLPLLWGSLLGLDFFGCRGSAGADVFAMDFFGTMKNLLTGIFDIFEIYSRLPAFRANRQDVTPRLC